MYFHEEYFCHYLKENVGWANGSIVNPTFLSILLGCQRDGSPTYDNNFLIALKGTRKINH